MSLRDFFFFVEGSPTLSSDGIADKSETYIVHVRERTLSNKRGPMTHMFLYLVFIYIFVLDCGISDAKKRLSCVIEDHPVFRGSVNCQSFDHKRYFSIL